MKKLYPFLFLFLFLFSCEKEDVCGTYNGNTLYKGPKDGCYYKNSSGNKEYVDRNLCKC
jgi:hypothetical protein